VALPEIATTKLLDAWQHAEILRRTLRLYALDIHNAARSQDRSYFRQSREKLLHGRTLEEFPDGARAAAARGACRVCAGARTAPGVFQSTHVRARTLK